MNQLVPATPGQSLVCLITADHQGLGQCLAHSRDSCTDLYPSGSVTFLSKKQLASHPASQAEGWPPQESLPGRSAGTEPAPNSSRAAEQLTCLSGLVSA